MKTSRRLNDYYLLRGLIKPGLYAVILIKLNKGWYRIALLLASCVVFLFIRGVDVMDRTEEVETLKKVVFNLQFKMALKKNNKDELLEISEEAQIVQKKIDALLKEIEESNGQVGFGFSDLIDVTKVKKGR